jgi:hypothetical protein
MLIMSLHACDQWHKLIHDNVSCIYGDDNYTHIQSFVYNTLSGTIKISSDKIFFTLGDRSGVKICVHTVRHGEQHDYHIYRFLLVIIIIPLAQLYMVNLEAGEVFCLLRYTSLGGQTCT